MRILLSSACALWMLAGCDDEGSNSAPAKCRTLARQVCEALIDCELADESDLAECIDDVAADAECADAVEIDRGYARCLDDVASAAQCDEWPSLPASCVEIVKVPD